MPCRFLSEQDVRRLLPAARFPALVDLMQATLVDFSAGRVVQPVRTAVPVGPPGQYLGVMPALLSQSAGLGTKLVNVVPSNATRGLSTHMGIIALFHPETGAPLAVMDARYITEVRTAAVSSVSVRLLARPDAASLAILGTGVQGRSHLEGLASVRTLRRVRAWSPNAAELGAYCREMSAKAGTEVRPAASAEEAVRGAEIVVLATASEEPVIQDEWIGEGTHVVSIGACRPHQREMDPRLLTRGRVVVDSRAAARVESGDIVRGIEEGWFAVDHIAGEIGEVAAGIIPGRTSPNEVTLFKSLGLAAEDVATAVLVLRYAEQEGIGIALDL